jgi:hypothetical protein
MLSKSLFLWVAAKVVAHRFSFASLCPSTVAEVVFDVIGWRTVQLLYQVNWGPSSAAIELQKVRQYLQSKHT